MNSIDLLRESFVVGLELESNAQIETLEYRAIPEWDSIGHMSLVAEIEDRFDVMLTTDQVIGLSSYQKAIEILTEYNKGPF